MRATVTAKRTGQVSVHLRRAVDCWDPDRRLPLAVEPVQVVVHTARGRIVVPAVDHRVTSLTLP